VSVPIIDIGVEFTVVILLYGLTIIVNDLQLKPIYIYETCCDIWIVLPNPSVYCIPYNIPFGFIVTLYVYYVFAVVGLNIYYIIVVKSLNCNCNCC